MRRLYLKTQAELLDLIENTVGDESNARWADNDIYRAINVALDTISERVQLPRLYTLTGGFSSGTYEYTIPSYVGDNFQPFIKSTILNDWGLPIVVDYDTTWTKLISWTVEPAADGTRTLRLYTSPYTEDGRLVWWAPNGPVPLLTGSPSALPDLNAEINSTATSLVLDRLVPEISEAGWVKIDGEWISYAGVTWGTATTTLSGLVRAQHGTTAATHAAAAVVYFGVAVDDVRIWRLIEDLAVDRLHYILLHRGTTDDRSNHERLMSFLEDKTTKFFRNSGYVPARHPSFKPIGMGRY